MVHNMFNNKRGILEGVTDYLLLVLGMVFLIFFLGNYLTVPIEHGKELSLNLLAQFHYTESAIQNIRVQEALGLHVDPLSVNSMVQNSKVLSGRVITSCRDYISRVDCTGDAVSISLTGCIWDSMGNACSLVFREPTGIGRLPGGSSS